MVYDAHRPELFLKDAMWRRTVGPGESDRHPRGLDVERAGGRRSGSSSALRGRDRRLHDRQRRLLTRHRGREPALPAPGEGLRECVLDRAGRSSIATGGARCSRSRCGSSPRTASELFGETTSTARMRTVVRGARLVAPPRQPRPTRQRPADRNRHRAPGRVHAPPRPPWSRSTCRGIGTLANHVALAGALIQPDGARERISEPTAHVGRSWRSAFSSPASSAAWAPGRRSGAGRGRRGRRLRSRRQRVTARARAGADGRPRGDGRRRRDRPRRSSNGRSTSTR